MTAKLIATLMMAASTFVAQAEEEAAKTEGEKTEATGAEVEATKKTVTKASFTSLPLCRAIEGVAEVMKPGGSWEPAREGKFYPLGCSYRTGEKGALTLALGHDSFVKIGPNSAFGTRQQILGLKTRTIILTYGTIDMDLADNLPDGAVSVTAPGFTVKNPAGESRFTFENTPNGDRAVLRCVTGTLGIEGRHFDIPSMRAANEVVITTEHDHLVTILENTSGDYLVKLDQGVKTTTEVAADGSRKEVQTQEKAELKLSPKMKINIFRSVPAIGSRMSVFIIAFDAASNPLGSGVSFCEGRAEVNSGEFVALKKTDGEKLAKRAAEAAETTEVTEESGDEEKSGEEKAEEKKEESEEDSSDDE